MLKPNGVSVVIATNKWLDVRYGIPLQEYFLNNTYLDYIYDSNKRSFSADVNTAITIIRKPEEQDVLEHKTKGNLTRFVYFNIPYGQVVGSLIKNVWSVNTPGVQLNNNNRFRISVVSQSQLYSEGIRTESDDYITENETIADSVGISVGGSKRTNYEGTKWGNLQLHAPQLYYVILNRGQKKFRPLSEACRAISRGSVTGDDDFFILKEISTEDNLLKCRNKLRKESFYLETEFCPKVLWKPPRDLNYEIDNDKLKFRIFRCRKDRSQLEKTYALKYIEWAETSEEAIDSLTQGIDKGKRKRILIQETTKIGICTFEHFKNAVFLSAKG